jgi:hypothetical protein
VWEWDWGNQARGAGKIFTLIFLLFIRVQRHSFHHHLFDSSPVVLQLQRKKSTLPLSIFAKAYFSYLNSKTR